MIVLSLAMQSLKSRLQTVFLTFIAVSLTVALFLSVEKIRSGAHSSFENTVSDMNVIVGARTGSLNLLLLSVFRIGEANAPVSWAAYEALSARDEVAWAVPISLGDSHKGFRVLGTQPHYFDHYKYGDKQLLPFREGNRFSAHSLEVVIGSTVAESLGYTIGDHIVISHGIGQVSFDDHDAFQFEIVGIIDHTGTPVDRTVHIDLEALERIHAPSTSGGHAHDEDHHDDHHEEHADHLEPDTVTAVFIGTKSPSVALSFVRMINTQDDEPLSAIIPAETLRSLWDIVGNAESALLAISVFVIIVGLTTILIAILTSLNERRREMAVLRSIGARPFHIFSLITLEAMCIAFLGALFGVFLVWAGLSFMKPWLVETYGFSLISPAPNSTDFIAVLVVSASSGLLAVWPATRATRNALADGLSVRV